MHREQELRQAVLDKRMSNAYEQKDTNVWLNREQKIY